LPSVPENPFSKPGVDPIRSTPTNVDLHHVVTTMSRYEDSRCHRVRDESDARQGITANRWDADVRKARVNKIDMETYEVNAPAVAEAILARLLAGRALRPPKDD
jgi:hypothetical protein